MPINSKCRTGLTRTTARRNRRPGSPFLLAGPVWYKTGPSRAWNVKVELEDVFLEPGLRVLRQSIFNRNFQVNAVIHAIGIGMYASRQIKTYSGGNKRRLSLGIAIVGLPDVLLLDEPTSGVDPKARRIIWNILNRLRDLGTALVLTSHSMDECEALCTELAIMVYGEDTLSMGL